MEINRDLIADKVQTLSETELAVLLCLITEQHCIIETEKDSIDDLEQELRLVAQGVFGLTWAALECNEHTTLDDFGSGILIDDDAEDYFSSKIAASDGDAIHRSASSQKHQQHASKSPRPFSPLDSRKIANIVVAKNLNMASSQVQVQALELVRGKRNFTRTAVHAAPRPFLFVALKACNTARFSTHLNDQFFISHKHQDEDGLPNLEALRAKEVLLDDDASTASVVRSPPELEKRSGTLVFSKDELTELAELAGKVTIASEVRAYLHNIVVFMRLHRAVAGGISAMATRHFNLLAHALAPLHGLSYITPSLVALAARKIYPHRISITSPENERSMQWGSSLEAVKAVLEGVTVEDVIEEVLQSVEAPL